MQASVRICKFPLLKAYPAQSFPAVLDFFASLSSSWCTFARACLLPFPRTCLRASGSNSPPSDASHSCPPPAPKRHLSTLRILKPVFHIHARTSFSCTNAIRFNQSEQPRTSYARVLSLVDALVRCVFAMFPPTTPLSEYCGTSYDMGHVSLYLRLWCSGCSTQLPLAVKKQGIYIPKLGLVPK